MDSELKGFYKKTVHERLDEVAVQAGLTDDEKTLLKKYGALDAETADRMIENVFSTTQLPLGIATNFKINGRDYLVPFAVEEPSVVAAASNAAKMARPAGGFTTSSTEPVMIGQIQLVKVRNPEEARKKILAKKKELMKLANEQDKTLVERGGGIRGIEARVLETSRGKMLVVHLLVDVRDAMGANAVNSMAEAVYPMLEEESGGKARLRIISNLAVHRTAKARAVWKKEVLEESMRERGLSGEEIIEAVLDAHALAEADAFRATTSNKGIMNGVDSVVVATGNDWRAMEAGAHAFASYKTGKYTTLTNYYKDENGDLVGEIELPVAVGIVGGATKTHPVAKIALKILGIKTARELGEVLAAVGLAQNFAAVRALVTEGIQRGHMALHAKNVAVMGGAEGELIEKVAARMVEEKNVKADRARQLVEEFKAK